MKRLYILLLLLATLTLSSCTTTYRVHADDGLITSLIGRSSSDVVFQLGSPTNTFNYPGGYVMSFVGTDKVFCYNKAVGQRPVLDLYFDSDNICRNAKVKDTAPVREYSPTKTAWLLTALDWLQWLSWWWY